MRLEKGVKQPDIAAYTVVTQLQNITLPKLQRSIRAQLAEGELAYLSYQNLQLIGLRPKNIFGLKLELIWSQIGI